MRDSAAPPPTWRVPGCTGDRMRSPRPQHGARCARRRALWPSRVRPASASTLSCVKRRARQARLPCSRPFRPPPPLPSPARPACAVWHSQTANGRMREHTPLTHLNCTIVSKGRSTLQIRDERLGRLPTALEGAIERRGGPVVTAHEEPVGEPAGTSGAEYVRRAIRQSRDAGRVGCGVRTAYSRMCPCVDTRAWGRGRAHLPDGAAEVGRR